MTATAQDTDKFQALEDGMRRAWKAYSDRLRGLEGDEYERTESESWTDLQHELRRLDRQRRSLAETSS